MKSFSALIFEVVEGVTSLHSREVAKVVASWVTYDDLPRLPSNTAFEILRGADEGIERTTQIHGGSLDHKVECGSG